MCVRNMAFLSLSRSVEIAVHLGLVDQLVVHGGEREIRTDLGHQPETIHANNACSG